MKKILLFAFSACFMFQSFAQPVSSWANSIANNDEISGNAGIHIAHDAAGNVYVTGSFRGNITLGTIQLSNTSGFYIRYLAKYDSAGNLVWAQKIDGSDGIRISVDGSGNIYVSGYFNETINFNSASQLTSEGGYDMFVAKYNTNGIIQWVKQISGTGDQFDYGIGIDVIGNMYVLGTFKGSTVFDATATLYSNAGSTDLFIAKYDVDGTFVWVKPIGGANDEDPRSLTVDASGNVYIACRLWGTIDFDPGTDTHELSAVPGMALAKYNDQGIYQWAEKFTGVNTNSDLYNVVLTTDGSSIYLTGSFRGTVDFDPGSGTGQSANLAGLEESVYVAKYNAATAAYQWAKSMPVYEGVFGTGYSIALNTQGDVYVTGIWDGTIDFNPSVAGNDRTSVWGYDAFLVKYNASGNYQWMKGIGGDNDESALSIFLVLRHFSWAA